MIGQTSDILFYIMSHKESKFNSLAALTLFFFILSPQSASAQDKKTSHTEKVEITNDPVDESKPSEFEQLLDKELNSGGEKQNSKESDSTNWAYQIIKTIFGLAFVIIIIILVRKFLSYKNKFLGNDTGIIKLLYEYPIESGKKLQIIEVSNKLLLIGVSDAGIQLISEFKEQVFIDQIKLTSQAYGKTEQPDMWLDLTNLITTKVQSIFNKKTDPKMDIDDHSKWENYQSNTRLKVNELREKKKMFEDLDDSDEK